MKKIKDILEVIATVILAYVVAIIAFILFAISYYWFYLVFEPWYDNTFVPWLMNEIKIIFSHPENFCGFLFILWAFICLLVLARVLIGAFVSWVKKLVRGDKRI